MQKTLFATAITALILSSSAFALSDKQQKECLNRYALSSDAGVQAAGGFISDALDDNDYESINQMTAYIRQAQGLKAWDRPDLLDNINIDVVGATYALLPTLCGGRQWTLQRLQAHLLVNALPEYYKKNPDAAKGALWQE